MPRHRGDLDSAGPCRKPWRVAVRLGGENRLDPRQAGQNSPTYLGADQRNDRGNQPWPPCPEEFTPLNTFNRAVGAEPEMNSTRPQFLARSVMNYCFRIQCMAELLHEEGFAPAFAARTARDISEEAEKLDKDLEELLEILSTEARRA